jgi:hypothetical protein
MHLRSDSLLNRNSEQQSVDSRRDILLHVGASQSEADELLAYNDTSFDRTNIGSIRFPLVDELFVEEWNTYAETVGRAGSITALFPFLPQLQFPIQSGLRARPEYIDAVKRGAFTFPNGIATGLSLEAPHLCRVFVHPTAAGRIPVISAGSRPDFISLIRAFTKKGEPASIPYSMGAVIIGGYNNFSRIHRLHTIHLEEGKTEHSWAAVFAGIRQKTELYQDRFIILGSGAYSGVAAEALGIAEDKWHAISTAIRLGHECTHYFTRRVFGSMRNNLIDELIADYCGLDHAVGEYRAEWALSFLGLENEHVYRSGGRLENYLGATQLSQAAFRILALLVRYAICNLARFNVATASSRGTEMYRVASILTLTSFTLESLAAPDCWKEMTAHFKKTTISCS